MITIHSAGNARLIGTVLQSTIDCLSADEASQLIDEASAMIASYTGRVLQRQEVTQTWRDVCVQRIMVRRWPVADIVSVVVDGETLDPAEYEHDGQFIYRLTDDRRMAWYGSKIAIRYRGGYDPIPADLQRACLDLCVNLHATRGRDLTLRSVNIPDVETISFRDEGNGGGVMPAQVVSTLGMYREISL